MQGKTLRKGELMVITRFRSSPYVSLIRLTATYCFMPFAFRVRTERFCGHKPSGRIRCRIQDARNMTAEKISKNLTAIVPENKNLQWENNTPGSRVLVATWLGRTRPPVKATWILLARDARQAVNAWTIGITPGSLSFLN